MGLIVVSCLMGEINNNIAVINETKPPAESPACPIDRLSAMKMMKAMANDAAIWVIGVRADAGTASRIMLRRKLSVTRWNLALCCSCPPYTLITLLAAVVSSTVWATARKDSRLALLAFLMRFPKLWIRIAMMGPTVNVTRVSLQSR